MSVCPFVCLSPSYAIFLGLLLALRSHDQFEASHWSTPPPYSRGRLMLTTTLNVFIALQKRLGEKNIRLIQLIFSFLRNLVCTVLKLPVLSPWDKSVLILKWPKETQ